MKIALVASWSPRECGIATFSGNLRDALRNKYPDADIRVVAMHEDPELERAYSDDVGIIVQQDDPDSYVDAAKWINSNDFDVVVLQHEFGIFGPPNGPNVRILMKAVDVPIVTTFHTLPLFPGSKRRDERLALLTEIVGLSADVIVPTLVSRDFVISKLGGNPSRVYMVHHGAPYIPYLVGEEKSAAKDSLGYTGRVVILTFGLITANKGINFALRAIKQIAARHPEALYVIAGDSHPSKKGALDEMKAYVAEHNLEDSVTFDTRFLEEKDLIAYLQAADMLVTPYLVPEQISSGVLAWAIAAGQPVISTPYHYATEMLAEGRGLFVPMRSVTELASAMSVLIRNPAVRENLSRSAYEFGTHTRWADTAARCMNIYREALASADAKGSQ